MSEKKRLYVAYGSNLNLSQMEWRCPTAEVVGTAVLPDYELLFRGSGDSAVATVEPRKGASVPILLWDIRPMDEKALDRYEGYPRLYEKETVTVSMGGEEVEAMAYVMTPGYEPGLPDQRYHDVIAEGYRSAGFDLSVLEAAVQRSAELMAAPMEELAGRDGLQMWWPE